MSKMCVLVNGQTMYCRLMAAQTLKLILISELYNWGLIEREVV